MLKLGAATLLFFIFFGISAFSCSQSNYTTSSSSSQSKASSALLTQISLRKAQIANPTPERLAEMKNQGMNTADLGTQRIYIYVRQQLTTVQNNEIEKLGVTVYLSSWVPPTGNNPDGFYLADMPVDELDALAAQDYVVRLDTAEKVLQPKTD